MRLVILLFLVSSSISVCARRKVQSPSEYSSSKPDISSPGRALANLALSIAGPRLQSPGAKHGMSTRPTKNFVNLVPSRSAARPLRRALPTMASDVVEEDYKLAAALCAIGLLVILAPAVVGAPLLLLGSFLLFQTARIRFVFDEDSFEVKTKPLDEIFSSSTGLTETGDNFAVGGDNRWKYDSFVNWEFFPSVDLPVLVYFKEVQTPSDKWDVGPGKWANSDEALAKGAVKGQVHFFPCIAKAQSLKEKFIAKGCAKL